MSKHKYGMQKNVQNDLQQCINSFEHMKRGGIGIADELVCDTCKRALKYIDELEEKLSKSAPVRHGHWINENFYTHCSACGKMAIYDKYGQEVESDYCPNCGAKMDGEPNNDT